MILRKLKLRKLSGDSHIFEFLFQDRDNMVNTSKITSMREYYSHKLSNFCEQWTQLINLCPVLTSLIVGDGSWLVNAQIDMTHGNSPPPFPKVWGSK